MSVKVKPAFVTSPPDPNQMPAWERKMREAGVTPFWEKVDDPLTELLERASRVRLKEEEAQDSSADEWVEYFEE